MNPDLPRIDFEPLTPEEFKLVGHPPTSRTLELARYAYLATLLVGLTGLVFLLRAAGGA